MKKAGKISFWVLLIVVFLCITYYVYQVWWNGIDVHSVFAKGWNSAGITAKKATDFVKEKTGRTVNYVASGGIKYARKGASDTLSSLGGELQSLAGSIVGTTPTFVSTTSTSTVIGNSQTIPINTDPETTSSLIGSGFLLPPPSYAIAARTKQNVSFALNRESSFKVLWGDNTQEEGIVSKDRVVILSHRWERRGDYTVIFSITEKGIQQDFSFPVRIYE